ncbi:putative Sin3 associated polypeptide p18 [Helianthus annuus]|nr:putative Sin3 associated polypeptide p18 [Helianthus annuus]
MCYGLFKIFILLSLVHLRKYSMQNNIVILLLSVGGHHSQADFAVRGKEPKDEVQIYTWMDATLRELTDLVKEVAPEARRRDALLSFAFVYPTKTGHFTVKEVGKTFSYPNARRPDDGSKALGTLSFEIGDYLDVAIL